MKMPLYLALDLLGKLLILASVGVQLLVLTPLSDARARYLTEMMAGLAIANHRVNMHQYGVTAGSMDPSSKKEIAEMLSTNIGR